MRTLEVLDGRGVSGSEGVTTSARPQRRGTLVLHKARPPQHTLQAPPPHHQPSGKAVRLHSEITHRKQTSGIMGTSPPGVEDGAGRFSPGAWCGLGGAVVTACMPAAPVGAHPSRPKPSAHGPRRWNLLCPGRKEAG